MYQCDHGAYHQRKGTGAIDRYRDLRRETKVWARPDECYGNWRHERERQPDCQRASEACLSLQRLLGVRRGRKTANATPCIDEFRQFFEIGNE